MAVPRRRLFPQRPIPGQTRRRPRPAAHVQMGGLFHLGDRRRPSGPGLLHPGPPVHDRRKPPAPVTGRCHHDLGAVAAGGLVCLRPAVQVDVPHGALEAGQPAAGAADPGKLGIFPGVLGPRRHAARRRASGHADGGQRVLPCGARRQAGNGRIECRHPPRPRGPRPPDPAQPPYRAAAHAGHRAHGLGPFTAVVRHKPRLGHAAADPGGRLSGAARLRTLAPRKGDAGMALAGPQGCWWAR